MKKVMCSIDVIDIKQKIDSGRLRVKLNQMGDVLMEDTADANKIKDFCKGIGYVAGFPDADRYDAVIGICLLGRTERRRQHRPRNNGL